MKVGAQGGICMSHGRSLCVGFFYAETCTFLHSAEFILLLHIFEHQKLPRCWRFLYAWLSVLHACPNIYCNDQLLSFSFFPEVACSNPQRILAQCVRELKSKDVSPRRGSNIVKRMLYLLRTRMLHAVLDLVSGLFSERTMFIAVPASCGCSAHCFTHNVISTWSDFTHEWSLPQLSSGA